MGCIKLFLQTYLWPKAPLLLNTECLKWRSQFSKIEGIRKQTKVQGKQGRNNKGKINIK